MLLQYTPPNSNCFIAGIPLVTSLSARESNDTSVFTLNCSSTYSPATRVIWTKDSEVLPEYVTYQIMRDGLTTAYDTLLDIQADVDGLIGTYTCMVINSAGHSNEEALTIHGRYRLNLAHSQFLYNAGVSISGNNDSVTVGSKLELICSSDLAILIAEWLYDEVVISQSVGSEALLMISAVNDSMHSRQYLCRVTTPYGMQEINTTLTVTGKPPLLVLINEINTV